MFDVSARLGLSKQFHKTNKIYLSFSLQLFQFADIPVYYQCNAKLKWKKYFTCQLCILVITPKSILILKWHYRKCILFYFVIFVCWPHTLLSLEKKSDVKHRNLLPWSNNCTWIGHFLNNSMYALTQAKYTVNRTSIELHVL